MNNNSEEVQDLLNTSNSSKSSTSGSTYHNFYQKLKSDQGAPVRQILESFHSEMQYKLKKLTREEQEHCIQHLMTEMEVKFQEIFKEDEETAHKSGEGIENCVTRNLYKILFNQDSEIEYNQKLINNIQIHQQFIKPEHLDISTDRIRQASIERANHYLSLMTNYKSPLGKMTCIINFCKIISDMLKDSSKDGQPDGADTFIPAVVYSILQLKKEQCSDLKSNLEFIKRFRHSSRFEGEEQYYLITIESNVEFLHNLSYEDFKEKGKNQKMIMTEQEYDSQCAFAKSKLSLPIQDTDLLQLGDSQSQAEETKQNIQEQSEIAKEAFVLQQENTFLKKMLNEFLESTYKYRHADFEDLKIKEQREIFDTCTSLVNKLSMMTIDKSEQQSNNGFIPANSVPFDISPSHIGQSSNTNQNSQNLLDI